MLKVAVFLSNRATYFRQKALLMEMEADDHFELTCLLTSSLLGDKYVKVHNELHNLFNCLDMPAVSHVADHSDIAFSAARISRQMLNILLEKEYDAVGMIADRWELLPAAMSTAYLNIPLFHIQGGEDSSNIDQKVRHAVSMLSDLHFVSHKPAAYRLSNMGLDNIHVTGCPSIDIIKKLGYQHKPDDQVMCIFHPHTNEANLAKEQTEYVRDAVLTFCKENKYKLLWFAPNNDPGNMEVQSAIKDIEIIYNMSGEKFINMLCKSRFLVGNSSCGIRECSYLGIPAVNIGDRQKGRVKGKNVINSTLQSIMFNLQTANELKLKPDNMFGDGNASGRIRHILKGYLWERKSE